MQTPTASIVLSRDCKAVQVPYGNPVTLRAGTEVRITQSLGTTFTLQTSQGYMVRIEGSDGDAIGVTPKGAEQPETAHDLTAAVADEQIWDILRSVYDPEIPVNIVDLGLIYQCRIQRPSEQEAQSAPGARIEVEMTLTAPGCGMGDVLQDEIRRKCQAVPGVREVDVQLVLDPPWAADMMSESARLELGVF